MEFYEFYAFCLNQNVELEAKAHVNKKITADTIKSIRKQKNL